MITTGTNFDILLGKRGYGRDYGTPYQFKEADWQGSGRKRPESARPLAGSGEGINLLKIELWDSILGLHW